MKLFGGSLLNVMKTREFLQFIEETEYLKISLNKLMVHSYLVVTLSGYHMSVFSRCQIESNRNTVVCFGLLQCRQDKQKKCVQCQCSNVSEKLET